MNRTLLVVTTLALVLVAVSICVAQEKPWYDTKNCEFCKPWMTPEMMKNVTWEQHPIASGVMTMAYFPETFIGTYKKASAQMGELSTKATTGQKVQMCGSCEAMGMFFMRGANMEEVPLKKGVAQLMTSNDSTVVADMHKWAQRNADEEKKLKAVEKK
jgi:hypothetical protein